jgi:serine/threonine protein kinase/Tfp pilus assembly protein PilF
MAPGGFRVALKFVRLGSRLRSSEIRALDLIREIRHPNLIATFGSWQADSILIVAMELADGSLSDRFMEVLAQGLRGIPREELLGYLSDAAMGVDHLNAHRHAIDGRQGVGIQHRDLKPQNILLFGGGAKLGDFGLARIMERSVASHTAGWTVSYAAPEVFGGHTSRHSDQYGLAVTYCQLRGGRLPFGGSAAAITAGHLFSTPDLDALPEPERPVVARAMAKDPEARWPDCRSFVAALRAIRDLVPDTLALDEPGLSPCDPETFPIALDLFESDETPLISPSASWSWMDNTTSARGLDPALESMTSWFNPAGFAGPGPNVPEDGSTPRPVPADSTSDPTSDLSPAGMTVLPWEGSPGWVFQVTSQVVVNDDEGRAPELAAGEAGVDSSLTVQAPSTGEMTDPSPSDEPSAQVSSDGPIAAPDPAPGGESPDRTPVQLRGVGSGEGVVPSLGETGPGTGWARYLVLGVVVTTAAVLALAPKVPEDRPRADVLETPVIDSGAPVPARRVALGPPPGFEAPESIAEVGALASPAPERPSVSRAETPPALPDLPNGPEAFAATAVESRPDVPPLTGPELEVAEEAPTAVAPATSEVKPRLELDLPDLVKVKAGGQASVRVRVRRPGQAAGPVAVSFRDLPPGVRLECPTIPARAESVDAVVSAGGDARAAVARVRAVATRGDDRAESGLRVEVEPDPASAAFERGRRHLSARSYHRAAAEFTEVIRLDPAHPEAHLSRAIAETLEGRFREALDDYKEAIRLRPDDTRGYLARARTHHDLGNYAEALADYTEAIRLRPDVTAHYGRGLVRYHSGDYAGAIDDFTAVIRLDPNHAASYRYRGDAFARQGRGDRGEADHRTASRLAAGLSHPRTAKSN